MRRFSGEARLTYTATASDRQVAPGSRRSGGVAESHPRRGVPPATGLLRSDPRRESAGGGSAPAPRRARSESAFPSSGCSAPSWEYDIRIRDGSREPSVHLLDRTGIVRGNAHVVGHQSPVPGRWCPPLVRRRRARRVNSSSVALTTTWKNSRASSRPPPGCLEDPRRSWSVSRSTRPRDTLANGSINRAADPHEVTNTLRWKLLLLHERCSCALPHVIDPRRARVYIYPPSGGSPRVRRGALALRPRRGRRADEQRRRARRAEGRPLAEDLVRVGESMGLALRRADAHGLRAPSIARAIDTCIPRRLYSRPTGRWLPFVALARLRVTRNFESA